MFQVMEGYGQTECAGGATTTLPNEIEGGQLTLYVRNWLQEK